MKWTSLNLGGSNFPALASQKWICFSPADLLALFPVHSAEGAVAVEYLSCDAQIAEVMLGHVSSPNNSILLASSIVGWLASTVSASKFPSGPSRTT